MEDKTKDTVTPSGAWKFDGATTDAFEDMLERSIPQYEVMREAVTVLGSPFVMSGSVVIDLGCSRGTSLAPFVERFGDRASFIGVEMSEPMLEAARARFAEQGNVAIEALDLRVAYPRAVRNCLTLSILTLQFIPIEHRQRVLRDAYASLDYGGALILVEKVLGENAVLDQTLVNAYYAHKRTQGYTQDAIDRKRLSLEGILVPLTRSWNIELLEQAGFTQIDCFWRWMNFSGWIAIK